MPTEIDKDLQATLKQAKAGRPMQFAFLGKGTGGKLLAARKIMPAAISEAKKEQGGGTPFRGRIVAEDGKLVFEVAKEPPPNLAAQLKRTIKESAGLMWDVEVRVKGDAEEELREKESDQAPPPSPPPPSVGREQVLGRLQRLTPGVKTALAGPNAARVQTLLGAVNGLVKNNDFAQADKVLDELEPLVGAPPPPPGPDAKAAVMKRLGALTGAIKTALTGPNAARVQTLFGAINGLVKNNDFVQAGKVLDELEPLVGEQGAPPPPPGADPKAAVLKRLSGLTAAIKAALTGPNAARVQTLFGAINGLVKNNDFVQAGKILDELEPLVSAPSPGGGGAGRQAWERQFALVQPRYVAVLKTDSPEASKLRALMGFATGKAEAGEYDKALAALKQLEPLLGAAPGEGGGPVDDAAFRKSWAQARAELLAAVDTVGDQLSEFASVLMESGEENLVWIAEEGLSQVFNSLRATALTIDKTTSKAPAKVVAKVKPALDELRKQLKSPAVVACDENEHDVTVTIRESIGKAVKRLEAALAQAPPG